MELPAPDAITVDWLTRIFNAVAAGPSLFDPPTFTALSRVLAERVPHDGATLIVRDGTTSGFHVAVSAAATPDAPRGVIGPPSPEAEALLATARPIACDDTSRPGHAIDAAFRAARLAAYHLQPIAHPARGVRGWLALWWRTPGARIGPAEQDLLTYVVRLLSGFVPVAHQHVRAARRALMLDRLPHAVLGLDRDRRVVEANAAALKAVGRGLDSLLGRRVGDLLGEPARSTLARIQPAEPGSSVRMLLETLDASGALLQYDCELATLSDAEVIRELLYLEDAQPRLQAEAELRSNADALALLRDVAETVAGELRIEHALGRFVSLILQRLPVDGAAIARVPAPGGGLAAEPLARARAEEASREAPDALVLLAGRGVSDSALEAFLRHGVHSTRVQPAAPPLAAAVGAHREALVVSLYHAEQVMGAALFVLPFVQTQEMAATRELLLASSRTVAVALHAAIEYGEAVRLAADRRTLLDSIPSIVFRLDPDTGATLYANAAIERVLGTPAVRALGLPGLEGLLCDAAEREAMAATRRAVAGGAESTWVDRRFVRSDGRTLVLRTRLYAVTDARAGAAAPATLIEGIAQDVTDEIDARKQLIQADRLASLGMLAAGVAHEINNPTAFVSLGVQQLARMVAQMPDGAFGASGASGNGNHASAAGGGATTPAATAAGVSSHVSAGALRRRMSEVLAEVTDGIQRIVQIVGELKLFTRIPESAFSTPVDVNRLIVSAVTLARAEVRHRARLEVELGDLPPLPGDHARLGQVFVNLLVNAAQAIPPGDEERNVVRVATRAEDGAVVVEVSDTGVGIPPEHLPRIFDPFFTTKAPGEGTGLGLAISYDLVRRAGGTIEVASEVGRGTTFAVRLPVRDFAPSRGSKPRIAPVPPGGRLLIVEDEQHLAAAIARALAVTYMVELASDASSALERLARGVEEYDAILCDLKMPGMDGRAFFDSVRARWPALAERFVFLTGAGLGDEYEDFVRHTDRPVLEKPFEMSELEAVVAEVVSAPRRAT